MSRVGLHFNGTNTYCQIPISVASAQSWEVILSISTDLDNRAGNAIYNQPCIFGYDTGGWRSRDFHIDLSNGNLYIFSGLGGSQSSSQIKYGTITGNSDFGWNTGKYIADGAAHAIRAVYENNTISVYLDGEYLGYLNTPSTINSSYLCLGCSQPGEKVYSRYDLYDFTLKVDGVDSVIYAPDDADLALNMLTDKSGNSNDGTLYGTVSSVDYKLKIVCDVEREIATGYVALEVDCERKIVYRVGVHFNGTDTYCSIPISVASAQSWKATLKISTDLSDVSGNQIYNQPCIFGCDTVGVATRDFHIDLNSGNLYVFSGLGGSQSSSQIKYGTITGNSDFGWNTGKYIADGAAHAIRAVYENNTISVYLDGEYLGYLNTPSTINSSYLCLGCSQPGEKKYSRFDLYDFNLEIDGVNSVIYAPTSADILSSVLSDQSPNGNDGTLYGTVSSVPYASAPADVFYFDAIRMPKIPATLWQYENAGTTSDLINTNTAVQVNNLPQTQSKTGSAFYQTTENIALFDIATNTPEIWIKFDVYSQSYGWRVFDYTFYQNDSAKIVGVMSLLNFVPNSYIRFFNYDGNVYGLIASVELSEEIDDTLRTFILHMKADSTNGIIELFSDIEGLIYSFSGAVNGGTPFSKIDFVSGVDSGDADLFSNVIISNNPLWFYDNISADISVSFSADAQRELLKSLSLSFDAERQIVGGSIQQNFYADAQRQIVIQQVIEIDTERSLIAPVELVCDTTRLIKNVVTTQVDIEIVFSYYLEVSFDISRVVVFVMSVAVDCEREIFATVDMDCDIFRKLVRNIVVPVYVPPEYNPPSHDAPVFPRPEDNSVIQSCTISMQEQQLTDNISFVYAAHVNIMDAVNLQFLDYIIRGRVEETTTKGILESCYLTCDVDEILYRQLAYKVPENKFEWTAEYLAKINRYNAEHEEQVEKIPSAPASAHITEIASKLGKNVSLQFTDFISTMSTTVQSGTNYAGLISELFGWTSRIPHLMINVYMRDNTIHVIQRGQEQNTIVLDNAKLAEPTIKRKLMRMTWGSDPWSKTEVVSRMKEWSEFDQSPYSPQPEESPTPEGGGGSSSYGDDNLIKKTTVTHGEETVETTYEYKELGEGQKFLYKEIAKTYISGELVDTVETKHEPVSYTQAHVYSTDDDGVIGGAVTNSNFDDRITPYQQEQIAGGGVYGHSDGMIVHDKDGNQYLLYGIAHHQDKEQIGNRTINGVTLIDTSFPVDGEAMLKALTDAIIWLDRKTEESITIDVYDYPHVIDFNDKISLGGNIYYLRSNTVTVNEKIRNKQTLEIVRWF